MLRLLTTYILLSLFNISAFSEKIAITASAPKSVEVGETFRVTYEINTHDISKFEAPDFKGFHVIDSHNSSSTSTTIINGQVSTKSSTLVTFVLEAVKEGDFVITPASVYSSGNKAVSKSLSIHVSKASGQSASSLPPSGNTTVSPSMPPVAATPPPTSAKANGELFVRAIVSKQKVWEQEAVLLTYKIYASLNASVSGFQGKLPVLNGFHIQELDIEQNQSRETYNGKNYMTAIWKQYLLFPQSVGRCEIPSIQCEAMISTQNGYMDPFGMFPRTETKVKKVETSPVVIEVMPLPSAPATFCGAVGNFSINSSINKRRLKSSDVLSVKVTLDGVGNMKLMDTPSFKFPDTFETYDSKVTENLKVTPRGQEGSKTFEYLAVPREGGTYTIGPMEFSYFNPSSGRYETISTDQYEVDVESDGKPVVVQHDIDQLNKDIKFIKTGLSDYRDGNITQLYSWKWIVAYLSAILLFILCYLLQNKMFGQGAENGRNPIRGSRGATRLLHKAKQQIETGNREAFFDEMLNSLYDYTQNKLHINRETFNKELVGSLLASRNVDEPTINAYLSILNDCEFARYAPSSMQDPLSTYYERAVAVINRIDSTLKKNRHE